MSKLPTIENRIYQEKCRNLKLVNKYHKYAIKETMFQHVIEKHAVFLCKEFSKVCSHDIFLKLRGF